MYYFSAQFTKLVSCLILCFLFLNVSALGQDAISPKRIWFEENVGQNSDEIFYTGKTRQTTVRFLAEGLSIAATGADKSQSFIWNTHFLGAKNTTPTGRKKNPVSLSYLSSEKSLHPSAFEQVWYEGLYENIDLKYYFREDANIEYDFILHPGAKAEDIRFLMEGVKQLQLSESGNLIFETPLGKMEKSQPYSYQIIGGKKVEVPSSFVLNGDEVSFQLGEYNASEDLYIDPVIVEYSTFLGGSEDESMMNIAHDANGDFYLTGFTNSSNLPVTSGVYQSSNPPLNTTAFVIKMDAISHAIVYCTYLGGSDRCQGVDIVADSLGSAYVLNIVNDNNFNMLMEFPTTAGSYKPNFILTSPGGSAVAVSKLSPDGSSLIYSTFLNEASSSIDALSTNLVEYAYLDVNSQKEVVACFNYPVAILSGMPAYTSADVGVIKLNAAGSAALMATHIVGDSLDKAAGIHYDNLGNVYVLGATSSSNIPTTSDAVQTATLKVSSGSGLYSTSDAFLVQLSPTGSLLYGTNLCEADGNSVTPAGIAKMSGGEMAVLLSITKGNITPGIPTIPGGFGGEVIGTSSSLVLKFNTANQLVATTSFTPLAPSGSGGFDIDITPCDEVAILSRAGASVSGGGTGGGATVPLTSDALPTGSSMRVFYVTIFSNDLSTLRYSSPSPIFSQRLSISDQGKIGLLANAYATNNAYITADAARSTTVKIDLAFSVLEICPPLNAGQITSSQVACSLGDTQPIGSVLPASLLSAAPTLYLSGTPLIQPVPNISYLWQYSTNGGASWIDIAGANQAQYLPPPTTTNTLYRRIVRDCCGNEYISNIHSLTISLVAPTVAVNPATAYICQTGSTPFSTTASGGSGAGSFSYSWNPPTFLSNPSIANPICSAPASTIYNVTVTDNVNGCQRTEQVSLVFVAANAGVTKYACDGTGVMIGSPAIPTNPPGQISYSWSPTTGLNNPNIANPIANPSITTTYTLTVTGPSGCPSSDMVTVIPFTTQNNVGPTDRCLITTGGSLGNTISVGTPAVPNYQYLWTSSAPFVSGGIAGDFLPTVATANPTFQPYFMQQPDMARNPIWLYRRAIEQTSGCMRRDSIRLALFMVLPTNCPNANIGHINGPVSGYSYSWTGPGGFSSSSANPVASNGPGTYTMNVNNGVTSCSYNVVVSTCTPSPGGGGGCNLMCLATPTTPLQIGPSSTFPAGYTFSWLASPFSQQSTIASPSSQVTTVLPTVYTQFTLTVYYPGGSVYGTYNYCVNVPPSVPMAPDVVRCPIDPASQIGSAPQSGFNYNWWPPAGLDQTNVPQPFSTPDQTTTYIMNAYNPSTSCTLRDSVEVEVRYVVADAGEDAEFCANGFFELGSTALPNYSYSWSPTTGLSDPNIAQPTVTLYGTQQFVVLATDLLTGCSRRDTVLYTDLGGITGDAGAPSYTICLGGTGIQLGTSDSSAVGYTYLWTPATGLSCNTCANPIANPSTTTTYTLTISKTGAQGCDFSDVVQVIVNNSGAPIANAGPDVIYCRGASGVQIGTAPSGGLTYSWTPTTGLSNPNIANPFASPSTNTTYTLTVNNGACSNTDNVLVTVVDPPTADAGPDRTMCVGGTETIGSAPVSGATYSWSPTTGLSDPFSSNPTVSIGTTTTYTVTMTLGGCTDTDAVTVTVTPGISANAGPNVNFCSSPVQIGTAGVPGYSYSWSPATGLNDPSIAQPMASPTVVTTYTVTVTSPSGCQATDQVIVTPSLIYSTPSSYQICLGSSLPIGPTSVPGLIYNWSPSTYLNNPSIAQPTCTPFANINYNLMISNGFCSANVPISVSVVNTLANAGTDLILCQGAQGQIGTTAVSGFSYSWSPTTGLSNPNAANPFVTGISGAITYTLTVTHNSSGCQATDQVNVTTLPISVTANAGADQIVCAGLPTVIGTSAMPNRSYSWTPALYLNNPSVAQPTATLPSNVPSQNFILTVTDNLTGCTRNDTMLLQQLIVTVNAGVDVTVCSGSNVNIGTSPTAGYTYSWSPSSGLACSTCASTSTSVITSTNYVLTATSPQGCIGTDNITVTVSGGPAPLANAGANISACENAVGIIQLGSSPIFGNTYSWSPVTDLSNPSIANPTINTAGLSFPYLRTYTVYVTGSNGCTNSDQVSVQIFPDPTATIASPDLTQLCAAPTLIGLQANALGLGESGQWTQVAGPVSGVLTAPNNTNTDYNPAIAGLYQFQWSVSNSGGCFANDVVQALVWENPTSALAGGDQSCQNPFNMSANIPAIGTGQWSVVSGIANIVNPTDPFSAVFVTANSSAVIRWTVTNGTCTSSDDVVLDLTCILPVELLSYQVIQHENSVSIDWRTAFENNNDYFEVQRVAQLSDLPQTLARVDGKIWSTSPSDYHVEDENPLLGDSYYRIIQVDIDGNQKEYAWQHVLFGGNPALNTIGFYPNPSSDFSTLEFSAKEEKSLAISVVDVNGKLISQEVLQTTNGRLSHKMSTKSLSPGIYFVKIKDQNGDNEQVLKWIVE